MVHTHAVHLIDDVDLVCLEDALVHAALLKRPAASDDPAWAQVLSLSHVLP